MNLQRLFFLEAAHSQHVQHPDVPLSEVIRQWQPFYSTGKETTFHTLQSLQWRASSIVFATPSEPTMAWKEGSNHSTLIYKGKEISVSRLQNCVGAVEDAAAELLQHKLLFSHDFPINITALQDDMGNTEPGFSLFNYRPNVEVFGFQDALALHIMTTPHLCQEFIIDSSEDNVLWNPLSLSRWLHNYAQLDLLCLVQVEMNCGAPGRTTELTAMSTINTFLGVPRAPRLFDGHFVLMRTYTKTRSTTGVDRLIPHSLNASLAAFMIYKEAICRPFAQLCASILFPDNSKAHALYQDTLFVNYGQMFVAADITSEMQRWTLDHFGLPIGIRDWRQVSTPLRRHWAGLQEDWVEDEQTADSAQAGHSHVIDRMHYGVTTRSAFGLAEDYIGPYLTVSKRWQRLLHLIPGRRDFSNLHSLC